MSEEPKNRADRRAEEQAKRDRDRRTRAIALRTAASLADHDETVSGFTIINPSGEVQYLDADTLRRGGRA